MSAYAILPIAAGQLGVDEAGRGPLAGPVVAAAVMLDPMQQPDGITDSKQLSASQRERLAPLIKQHALAWQIAVVDALQIDAVNILQATLQAMQQAVAGIQQHFNEILVDGNRAPEFGARTHDFAVQTVVKGDARHVAIAAASILAKTHRDALMAEYATRWPAYGFAAHKGYPTPQHLDALQLHGPCEIHRRSFAPVRRAIAAGGAGG
ncbi:MAG: ribonuclease HII [Pseudomonadota bacterium]